MLDEHADAADVAVIRAYLRAEPLDCVAGDMFVVCDFGTSLARYPEPGPDDELGECSRGSPTHTADAISPELWPR